MHMSSIDGVIVLEPSGAVCEYNVEAHQELISIMMEVAMLNVRQDPLVLVDLGRVTFMNSSGLGQLVLAYTSTLIRRGRFALCAVPPRIMTLLTVVKLNDVFVIYQTREAALTSMKTPAE